MTAAVFKGGGVVELQPHLVPTIGAIDDVVIEVGAVGHREHPGRCIVSLYGRRTSRWNLNYGRSHVGRSGSGSDSRILEKPSLGTSLE